MVPNNNAKKSNTVRNLLIIGGVCAIGVPVIGVVIYSLYGIDQFISNLFTLGGVSTGWAIAANVLAILSATCLTIALCIAINKKIQSKTLKSLVNFVLFLALGMVSVALLAFMFGITFQTFLAGFVDLGSVFAQGASAEEAVLTGSIFAVILLSLVIGFVTYIFGLKEALDPEETDDMLEFEENGKLKVMVHFGSGRKPEKKNYNVYLEDETKQFKYVELDESGAELKKVFYSASSTLKNVNAKDLDSDTMLVIEYEPPVNRSSSSRSSSSANPPQNARRSPVNPPAPTPAATLGSAATSKTDPNIVISEWQKVSPNAFSPAYSNSVPQVSYNLIYEVKELVVHSENGSENKQYKVYDQYNNVYNKSNEIFKYVELDESGAELEKVFYSRNKDLKHIHQEDLFREKVVKNFFVEERKPPGPRRSSDSKTLGGEQRGEKTEFTNRIP